MGVPAYARRVIARKPLAGQAGTNVHEPSSLRLGGATPLQVVTTTNPALMAAGERSGVGNAVTRS